MGESYLMAVKSIYTKLRQNCPRQCTLFCLYPTQLGLVKIRINMEDIKIWLKNMLM
jgi:hypothetical protein